MLLGYSAPTVTSPCKNAEWMLLCGYAIMVKRVQSVEMTHCSIGNTFYWLGESVVKRTLFFLKIMAKNKYTGLINGHHWGLLMETITTEVELKFPDINSFESFRVSVYQANAEHRQFNMSICRKNRTIKISKVCL